MKTGETIIGDYRIDISCGDGFFFAYIKRKTFGEEEVISFETFDELVECIDALKHLEDMTNELLAE